MTTEFDTDTALEQDGDRWRGTLTDRWDIGGGANGGYVASFPLRAMLNESPFPQPLTMTTHYFQRPSPGAASVHVERDHAGRSHAFLRATLAQEHGAVAASMAVFGRFRPDDPMSIQGGPPADWPGPDECHAVPVPPDAMSFLDRFERRFRSEDDLPFARHDAGPAFSGGWTRLVDRDLDALTMPLVMDSFPPPIFATMPAGGVPTVELTVHWRGVPTTRWHLGTFRSRFLVGGYVEEDGELWDEHGRLIALSRQLARFFPPFPV